MADITKVLINGIQYTLADLEARQISASGMVIKGTASSAEDITDLTNYVAGWCYKASAAFTIPDLGLVENGDMIIAISGNASFQASDWNILQNNVDTFTGATASTAGTRGLVPAPGISDVSSYLKGDGTWGIISSTYDDIIIVDNYIFLSSQESISQNTVTVGNCFTIANNRVFITGTGDGDVVNHILSM